MCQGLIPFDVRKRRAAGRRDRRRSDRRDDTGATGRQRRIPGLDHRTSSAASRGLAPASRSTPAPNQSIPRPDRPHTECCQAGNRHGPRRPARHPAARGQQAAELSARCKPFRILRVTKQRRPEIKLFSEQVAAFPSREARFANRGCAVARASAPPEAKLRRSLRWIARKRLVRLPHQKHTAGQALHDDEGRAQVRLPSGEAHGTAGTGMSSGLQGPKQRSLPINIGIAAAGNPDRGDV